MPAFFDQFLGAEVEFPDSMDPTKQQAALGELYRQRQQQQSYQNLGYLGQLIGGMGNQQRTIPRATVTPTAAFAMTPQALQSYMGQQQERLNQESQMQWASQEKAQERQQQNAIEQARQQQQLKRDIQTEKFRGDQLKLQKMVYDNQQKERDLQRKMREDAAKAKQEADAAKAEREAAQGKFVGNVNLVWDEGSQSWTYRPIQGLPAAQSLARGGGGGGGSRSRGGGGGGRGSAAGGGGEGEKGNIVVKWDGQQQRYRKFDMTTMEYVEDKDSNKNAPTLLPEFNVELEQIKFDLEQNKDNDELTPEEKSYNNRLLLQRKAEIERDIRAYGNIPPPVQIAPGVAGSKYDPDYKESAQIRNGAWYVRGQHGLMEVEPGFPGAFQAIIDSQQATNPSAISAAPVVPPIYADRIQQGPVSAPQAAPSATSVVLPSSTAVPIPQPQLPAGQYAIPLGPPQMTVDPGSLQAVTEQARRREAEAAAAIAAKKKELEDQEMLKRHYQNLNPDIYQLIR